MPENLMSKENLIVYLVCIIFGFGGNFAAFKIQDPRPDPFTGAQGDNLSIEIAILSTELKELRKDFDSRRVPPPKFERRVEKLEDTIRKHGRS